MLNKFLIYLGVFFKHGNTFGTTFGEFIFYVLL
jgi:hypothetical protein